MWCGVGWGHWSSGLQTGAAGSLVGAHPKVWKSCQQWRRRRHASHLKSLPPSPWLPTRSFIILKYMDLITIAVPPALPACLTVATAIAVARLQVRAWGGRQRVCGSGPMCG